MTNYKAKRQFTDAKGKAHKPGDPFQGSQEEIDKQVDAGNIEVADPSKQPGGGERGGAPT
jgi:hypothetical protein